MRIVEVDTRQKARKFLSMQHKLYENYPKWIHPLEKDIKAIFDLHKNPHFSDGVCKRWILIDDDKNVVGRIAAFIDFKTSSKQDQPTGGIGFFECIDDDHAAKLLFDTGKNWLMEHKMEAMDGPINFGERDKWWGLLISGFDLEPNYCMNYNPLYYKRLFENYGFREYYKQYTYYRKVSGGIDKGIHERADRVARSGNFRFSNIEHVALRKVAEDFKDVYNQAWSSYPDFTPMTSKHVQALLKQIRPIMNRKLIWFGYYSDRPIAFAVMLPEVNQIFKYMNGRSGIFYQLKFLWLLRKGICNKMLGVAFGIVPRFHRKGIESAMIKAISEMTNDPSVKFNYTEVEHNWVGDFNPQMMHVHELMGGTIRKIHATYRYLFDRNKEFKRAPEVN